MAKIGLLVFVLLLEKICGKTEIRTLPMLNVSEEISTGEEIWKLSDVNFVVGKELKMILLNVNGFEENYFQLRENRLKVIKRIDREEFLLSKKCFDWEKCLIEIHLLINDGEEYWIIPLHILDLNDNEPKFEREYLEMKFSLDEEIHRIFSGAKDLDEKENGQIFYLLDCSTGDSPRNSLSNDEDETWKFLRSGEKSGVKKNCLDLFSLEIFSKSSRNEFDQLKLKISPNEMKKWEEKKVFNLILFAFDGNEEKSFRRNSSMKIRIEFEKRKDEKNFHPIEEILIIKEKKENYFYSIRPKLNFNSSKIRCEIFNFSSMEKKNSEEIFFRSFEEKILVEIRNFNWKFFNEIQNEKIFEIYFSSIYFDEKNLEMKKFYRMKLKIFYRNFPPNFFPQLRFFLDDFSQGKIEEKNSSSTLISIEKENFSSFHLEIRSKFYFNDQFDVHFSLLNQNENRGENFFSLQQNSTKRNFYSFHSNRNEDFQISLSIEHRLTRLIFSSSHFLQIQFLTKNFSCEQNESFHLEDFQGNFLSSFSVVSPSNGSFSPSILSQIDENLFSIDQCSIVSSSPFESNSSIFRFCSTRKSFCSNVTFTRINSTQSFSLLQQEKRGEIPSLFSMKIFLFLSFSFIFLSIFLFLCSFFFKFSFCRRWKNSFVLGKKYQLSQIQRRSTAKVNSRIESIVIKESQSPTSNDRKLSISQISFPTESPRESKDETDDFSSILGKSTTIDEQIDRRYFDNFSLDGSRLASEV